MITHGHARLGDDMEFVECDLCLRSVLAYDIDERRRHADRFRCDPFCISAMGIEFYGEFHEGFRVPR